MVLPNTHSYSYGQELVPYGHLSYPKLNELIVWKTQFPISYFLEKMHFREFVSFIEQNIFFHEASFFIDIETDLAQGAQCSAVKSWWNFEFPLNTISMNYEKP